MKYKVQITERAKADYRAIHAYLKAEFGIKSAAKFKESFRKLSKALAKNPMMYEAVPERMGVRKCSAMSPTLVLYLVKEQTVEILHLYDGRRDSR